MEYGIAILTVSRLLADWDNIDEATDAQWEQLNNQAEELLDKLLTPAQLEEWKAGGKVAIVARDQELPDKNANNTWCDDDYGEAGKIGWILGTNDMLEDNFHRVVE